ncbi:uncharacterized protein LOC131019601 isoform X1 [Salvia miltiorrhiza]|uniref:uncharacterized protein LOC131019601 isoform X1 n=1 Tax=Salvia miltiorrhiza TaxID=226208 RepID=UPI0025AB5F9A|nr:uncharacterized protein LOC131019601 isoform X1 [Salvia miltiorrhiza]
MTGVQKSAVLYHYPCPDGAFGALAAYLYFSHSPAFAPPLFFPNTVYSPIRAENLPLNETDTVYLLDFVGPLGFVEQLSRKVGRVVVLDHHKTALEMLGSGTSSTNGNVTTVIDMDRSGATIAYDYFKEKLLAGDVNNHTNGAVTEFRRVRRLFEYIEDGDLWRWRLPNSKAFSSGLKDLNLEFDATLNPSLFQQLLSLELDSVISQGMSSLEDKQKKIEKVLELSYEITLGGGAFGNCLAVNADSIQELRSELGNELALKSLKMDLRFVVLKVKLDFALNSEQFSSFLSFPLSFIFRGIGAVVYRVPELENDSLLKISLRSIGDEDTTPISQVSSVFQTNILGRV